MQEIRRTHQHFIALLPALGDASFEQSLQLRRFLRLPYRQLLICVSMMFRFLGAQRVREGLNHHCLVFGGHVAADHELQRGAQSVG